MALFDLPSRASRTTDSELVKKSKANKQTVATVKSGNDLFTQISAIKETVERTLGQHRDEYILLRDETALHDYITQCIADEYVAIDTETMGLNPMLDDIVGVSLKSQNNKPAYIPINHINYITQEAVDNQIPRETVSREIARLKECKLIMHHASFDIRVILNHLGVKLICYWETYLASRLLNENEPSASLKSLYLKYILRGAGDKFSFSSLFDRMTFNLVPINCGYLYAAHDAEMTYALFEYQRRFLDENSAECQQRGLIDIARVFRYIEVPCVEVVADMENTGVLFDFEYNEKLKVKYHQLVKENEQALYEEISKYSEQLELYKKANPNAKLDNPINIGSPVQLAILLYDILGAPVVDKAHPRGTGEKILKSLDFPICKKILDFRAFEKLVSTYIDKLPECVNPNDGRIHCNFNQYGADTGRFSSDSPNLQNIPSHNKDIRKVFKATTFDGFVDVHDYNVFTVDKWYEIETLEGFMFADKIKCGDRLKLSDDEIAVVDKIQENKTSIDFICHWQIILPKLTIGGDINDTTVAHS